MYHEREVADYTDKARMYADSRPDYAPSCFQYLISLAGLTKKSVIADIGAGTGKSFAGFLDCVKKVYAVDSSEEMLKEAIRLFGCRPELEALIGVAENIPLDDSVADFAVVGQALHWFDLKLASRELTRILRPGSTVAIMWNDFGATPRPPIDGFLAPGYQEEAFDASYSEGWEQYIRGELSSHYAPRQADPGFEPFINERRVAFDAKCVNGLLTISLTTRVATGCLLPA